MINDLINMTVSKKIGGASTVSDMEKVRLFLF